MIYATIPLKSSQVFLLIFPDVLCAILLGLLHIIHYSMYIYMYVFIFIYIYMYVFLLQDEELFSDELGVFTLHSLCHLRVLDIHRYGPSRAVWGQRDFFCAVISKVSNCDGMFVWLPTPSKWVSDFYAKSYRPTCPIQKKRLHLTRNNQMFITWCKEVLIQGQSFYVQRDGLLRFRCS